MAKKKPTARDKQLSQLAKDYQANLQALGPEFESVFAKKQEKLSAYNTQLEEYQAKLEKFNEQLAAYKANPPQKLVSNTFDFNPYSGQVFVNVSGGWYETYPRNFLPSGYYVPGGGDYTNVYSAAPPPTFAEKEPVAPDLSEYEAQIAEVEKKKLGVTQTFEREKAERRSSTLRAVSQGSRERPMLSKGVTLNG